MRIVIAPDSFKGSLTAEQVAEALARGMKRSHSYVGSTAEVFCVPLADGGEGTARTLVNATGGRLITRRVTGPLGDVVEASFGILGDGRTAVIEMAEASGLTLVPEGRRDAGRTTTYGTGELMLAAIEAGCDRLIVAIGGSATNDGGTGMASALGVRFLDEHGRPIPAGGYGLERLSRVDTSQCDLRLAGVHVTVACDVDNPLVGPNGATHVFAPQKGADRAAIERLEAGMQHYAECLRTQLGVDVAHAPGAGAAGGLGAGLMAFCRAQLRPGFDIVAEAVGLEKVLTHATLAITGEGRIDGQTARGKVAAGVGRLGKSLGVPVIAVAGSVGDDALNLVPETLDAVYPIAAGPCSLEYAMAEAESIVERAGERLAYLLSVGIRVSNGGMAHGGKDY